MYDNLNWHNYLIQQLQPKNLSHCAQVYSSAFEYQRRHIERLIRDHQPHSIACLGSGYLNDIPIRQMFDNDKEIFFVDWLERLSRAGVANRIISADENENYACLFCDKAVGPRYCKNFSGQVEEQTVCNNFELISTPQLSCKQYQANSEPVFMNSDITAGIATAFATTMERMVDKCKTPKEAFQKAIRCSENVHNKTSPIPLDDHSMELITSSMIVSQFDVEPYEFFALLLENKFGRNEIIRRQKSLIPLMEELRTKLFVAQAEAHFREIHRLVKKDNRGRIYFSVELFRSMPNGQGFFMIQDIAKAMDLLGQYFYFDFSALPNDYVLNQVQLGDGYSIIQIYALLPRLH